MPTGQNSVRSPGSSGIQSYAVTDNPVFKVKIRSLATDLEQGQGQGRKDSETDYTKKYKVGDIVRGKKSGSEKVYTGKIIKIVKNEEGEGSAFIVIDKKSKSLPKILDGKILEIEHIPPIKFFPSNQHVFHQKACH